MPRDAHDDFASRVIGLHVCIPMVRFARTASLYLGDTILHFGFERGAGATFPEAVTAVGGAMFMNECSVDLNLGTYPVARVGS